MRYEVKQELRGKTTSNDSGFVFCALAVALLLYLLAGVYSTHSFPSQVLEADYGQNNVAIIMVRSTQCDLLVAVPVVCAMPLMLQPCRDSLCSMIWKKRRVSKLWHTAIVAGMVGSVLCFILPVLFYLKLFVLIVTVVVSLTAFTLLILQSAGIAT